jgi:hypothetical protein
LIAGAIATLILLYIGWHFAHSTPATTSTQKTLATVGREDATPAPASPAPPPPSAAVITPQTAARPAADSRTQWRVVAYTYNRQDQAQQKADLIAKQHPTLNPEVFTPTGRAPYLVTVGGPMTREQAAAFRKQAHAAGLPRDTYTQNYTR